MADDQAWLLIYTRAKDKVPWLAVEGVPPGVKRAEVLERLERWRRWSAFAPGPGGRLSLAVFELDAANPPPCQVVSWGELEPRSTVRVTVEIDGDVHTRMVAAARRSGCSQAAWVAQTIAAATAESWRSTPEPRGR